MTDDDHHDEMSPWDDDVAWLQAMLDGLSPEDQVARLQAALGQAEAEERAARDHRIKLERELRDDAETDQG